ncbi:MAG: pseudoazurin [Pseudomonadota bacterium]
MWSALKKAMFALAIGLSFIGFATVSIAEVHEVQMLNKHPDDKKKRNVFSPALIRIQPGDTVKFISADKGHNTESMKGMIPEGASEWKSKVSKDFEITYEKPGVYGYRCTPHAALGMVGLVVVEGEGWDDNLEAAQSVKQRGKAKKAFEELWAELEATN